MPAANASGEVFSLSADARYEGSVTARAGAGGQLGVSLEAEACHGLSLEASARALADVNAAIGLLFTGRGTGFATAAAGVAAKAQMRPDAFDRFGLILDAAAYAEASAGGRLAIGLDFGLLARWAQENLDGLTLQLFLAFLEEIVLEAGVWGRISAAAMAHAHADVTLSLADDADAGLVIEAGAAAGLGAGGGYDLYAGARFSDPRRFYGRAVRLITREAAVQARAALPLDLLWATEIVELALPTALECVYSLGQRAALGTLGPPEQMVEPLLAAFAGTMHTYLLDKAADAVPLLLDPLFERVGDTLTGADEPVGDPAEVQARLDALAAHVQSNLGRAVELADVPVLAGLVLDVAEAAAPGELDASRDVLALLWTGLACASGLDRPVASASASASAIGLGGVSTPAVLVELPPAPAFVLDAYHRRLGRNLAEVGIADAVDFLVEGLADALAETIPQAGVVLDDVAARFELTVGEVVETGVRLTFGGDLSALPAYARLRDTLAQWLDGVLRGEVVPALRQGLGPQGDDYVTQVAAPSLDALSTFVLEKLDAIVAGVSAGDESPFADRLSAGCSTLVYRIFARNALFLDQILFEQVLDGLHDAFTDLQTALRSDPDHVISRTLRSVLPSVHPGNAAVATADPDAVTELAATMAAVARDAFGPRVWTGARRERLRALKHDIVLGVEGERPFEDRRAVDELLRALVLCEYVPNDAVVEELAALLGEILGDLAVAIIPRGLNAWATFVLRLTRSVVEEIDRAARETLGAAAALVDAALAELERWGRALDDAVAALQRAAREAADALRRVEDVLRSADRRRDIRNALAAQGAAEAERFARGLDGDPDTVAPGEDAAVVVAVGTFHLAFAAIEPVLDLAFDAAEAVADDVAGAIDGAVDAADALQALVAAVVDAAVGAVADGLAALGLALPPELSAQDIADAIAAALPTDILLGLLDDALARTRAEEDARAAESDAANRRAIAEDAHRRRVEEEAALQPAGPIAITIGSPAPLPADPAEAFVHGPEVPVLVRVAGATPAFFAPGTSRRVLLAVNGRPVDYRPADWAPGVAGFEYTVPLQLADGALRPGLNMLEVSVADGLGAVLRDTVAFLVDPAAPSLRGTIAVDAALSVFDTAGDDHRHSDEERVAFRWTGRRGLSLEGWRVLDHGARHAYRFDGAELAPGAAIVLHTGGAPAADGPLAVHWGRRAAVWNNRAGDTVTLVDASGFVRATYVVPPRTRARR